MGAGGLSRRNASSKRNVSQWQFRHGLRPRRQRPFPITSCLERLFQPRLNQPPAGGGNGNACGFASATQRPIHSAGRREERSDFEESLVCTRRCVQCSNPSPRGRTGCLRARLASESIASTGGDGVGAPSNHVVCATDSALPWAAVALRAGGGRAGLHAYSSC